MTRAAKRSELGPLVVDANVLFGALLRDSTNRRLILHGQLDLHAPDRLWEELERNRKFLIEKSRATGEAFDLLMEGLKDHVRSVPMAAIRPHLDRALKRLADGDEFDAPNVAAALAIGGGVWSHDKALGDRADVPAFTTGEVLAELDH